MALLMPFSYHWDIGKLEFITQRWVCPILTRRWVKKNNHILERIKYCDLFLLDNIVEMWKITFLLFYK